MNLLPLHDTPAFGPGFILDWLVCGPFYHGSADYVGERHPLDLDFLEPWGGSARIRPARDMTMNVDGNAVTWREYHANEWWVNAQSATGFHGKQAGLYFVCCYFATYLESATARDIHLWLGSCDGYHGWWNGTPLPTSDLLSTVSRMGDPDRELFRVRLRKGRNLLLLKLINGRGGYGLCARLTDINERKLSGVKVVLPRARGKGRIPVEPGSSARSALVEGLPAFRSSTTVDRQGQSRVLEASQFKGGIRNDSNVCEMPAGSCRVVRAGATSDSTMTNTFRLENPVAGAALLRVMANLEDTAGTVSVNNYTVPLETVATASVWPTWDAESSQAFRYYDIPLPAGALKSGANRLRICLADHSAIPPFRQSSMPNRILSPYIALHHAVLVIDEATEQRANGEKVVRVEAERFQAALREGLLKTDGDVGYAFTRMMKFAPRPEPGKPVKAHFLMRKPGARLSHYVLQMGPIWMCWPWTRDHPSQLDTFQDPYYTIRINGHPVNNVGTEGGVRALPFQFYHTELTLRVDAGFVRDGLNELEISADETAPYVPCHTQYAPEDGRPAFPPQIADHGLHYEHVYPGIRHFLLREVFAESTRVLAVPRIVHVGRRFAVRLNLEDKDVLESVHCPDCIALRGKLPRKLRAGKNALWFDALATAGLIEIVLQTQQHRIRVAVDQVVEIADPDQYTYVGLTCYTGVSQRLDVHELDLDGLEHLDIANATTWRARLEADTSPELAEKIVKLHLSRGKRLVMWNTSKVPEVPQEWFQKWAGDKLLMCGTLRPEPSKRMYDSLSHVHRVYIAKLRKLYRQDPLQGCHVNELWHRYACIAGCRSFICIQQGYQNNELVLSSLRGTSRAFGVPFGVSNCDDVQLAEGDPRRVTRVPTLQNWQAYMAGCTLLFPECCGWWLKGGANFSFNRGFLPAGFGRRRLGQEQEFWDFLRTRGNVCEPEVGMAFVQGHLDFWDGRPGVNNEYMEGHYAPGRYLLFLGSLVRAGKTPGWPYGPPEAGWRYLDVVFPGIRFRQIYPVVCPTTRVHWFCPTPFGKVDITPQEAEAEALERYKVLFVPGWNTMTTGQYRKFKRYVKAGGTLFMSVAQCSTNDRRDGPIQPFRDGDLSDLFGVEIAGKGRLTSAVAGCATDNCTGIEQGETYALSGSGRNKLYAATVKTRVVAAGTGAEVVARDSRSGAPLLIRYRLGKGTAYLLTVWGYPGEENLGGFMRHVLANLARYAALPIRVEPADSANYSVSFIHQGADPIVGPSTTRLEAGETPTLINLTDINWWDIERQLAEHTLVLGGSRVPVTVRAGDMTSILWYRDLVLIPEDKRVLIEGVRDVDNGWEVVVQGAGVQRFRVCLLKGSDIRASIDGCKIRSRRVNNGTCFEATLCGRHALTLQTQP